MNYIELNVGLNVGNTLTHTSKKVLDLLPTNWANVECFLRRSSCNELTACISANVPVTLDVTDLRTVCDFLCCHLNQQAIAARHLSHAAGWVNVLEGPQKHLWNNGEFNYNEWLQPVAENNPLADGEAVLYALIDTTRIVEKINFDGSRTRRWEIGFQPKAVHASLPEDAPIRGWFENLHNGNGGELLFNWNDGKLELIDYDGVPALPVSVLSFLRAAGIDADRTFE